MLNNVELLTNSERRTVETTPEDGFVRRFVEWAAMKTDASVYALEAAAFQALSLAAGDVVVLPSFFGDKPIYMNLYIMLVGPSTTMRKTTVLGYIEGLLPVNEINGQSYVRVLDDVSIQAFNRELAECGKSQAPLLLSVDEVAGLFAIVRNKSGSYLSGFDKTLMKAYDHSGVHIARVGKNIDSDTGAFVNVFAASTPEPLVEVLSSDDVESGLLPRFLIFDVREAVRGERVSLGKRLGDHELWLEKRRDLQQHLAEIAKNRAAGVPTEIKDGAASFPVTVINFDDDAIERLDALDAEFNRTIYSEDTAIGAIKGRAFWHIVKLAGLYALSRGGLQARVRLIDVLRSMHLVETTIGDLVKMRDEVGSTLMERRIKEIENLLTSARRRTMKRSTVIRRLKLTAYEARQVQETLMVRKLVSLESTSDKDVMWIWTG